VSSLDGGPRSEVLGVWEDRCIVAEEKDRKGRVVWRVNLEGLPATAGEHLGGEQVARRAAHAGAGQNSVTLKARRNWRLGGRMAGLNAGC